eukprot:NODE_408_length_2105_cov_108.453794_g328_i0.p2 GENE.NODE_408_length_2105_cov_108.453794_g328_i0~~NODE_408_length_2105_cov_108.453794_g328_i0.p2  ORF type:complete len:652 (+),score=311.03 NODE_408_length_2105_cov_108.453794_g328_i0:127-1956(+)
MGLASGDKKATYPILFWVLNRMAENQKRVYLAKYLVPVEVPEDLKATDDAVREVFQGYQQLRSKFIQVHKQLDKAKEGTGDPEALAKKIKDLEGNREQLRGRLDAAQKKYDDLGVPQKEKFLDMAGQVRAQKDEAAKNKARTLEQKEHLKQVEKILQSVTQRHNAIAKDAKDLDPNKLLTKLREEVTSNKNMVSDRMPKEIENKRDALEALEQVLGSKFDLEAEKKSVQELQKDIQTIEDKHRPKISASEESQLGLFRQQAALVNKRKQEAEEHLVKAQEEKLKIESKIAEKDAEMDQFKGSRVMILRGEDFKKYAISLRGKSTTYRQMKAELQELRAEFGVLQRTQEILQNRDEDLEGFMKDLEDRHGVSGFRSVQSEALKVAEEKNKIDAMKSQTLDEISKTVQTFVADIREKRNKLAPQIMDLRNTRAKAQTIEQDYQAKKEHYDAQKAMHESELQKLQQEVEQYTDDAHMTESHYHRLRTQILMCEVALKKAKDEEKWKKGEGTLNDQFKTYEEMFLSKINTLATQLQTLRKDKQDIEDHHSDYLSQMTWFKSLKKFLDCKLSLLKREGSKKPDSEDFLGMNYLKLGDKDEQAAVPLPGGDDYVG